jgi:3-methyl-2-oxobutanoate hydroxymethyltransferase
VAKIVSAKLGIPVIGIGAGVHCDGQVLVTQDMLGMLKTAKKPRFVKEYANLYDVIKLAVLGYKNDVLAEKYPNDDFSY